MTASGVLKGFDPLLNLVLDGTIEYMRGEWSGGIQLCYEPTIVELVILGTMQSKSAL